MYVKRLVCTVKFGVSVNAKLKKQNKYYANRSILALKCVLFSQKLEALNPWTEATLTYNYEASTRQKFSQR